MENNFCTEAYIYGLEKMLEEARQTIREAEQTAGGNE